MCGREESTKVKLLLYLVGSQGQKIYSTMTFEVRERERNLKQVMDAFDKHCNPKKNETVERYKFFSRFQNPGEPLEKFITNLKLLATTCNFGDLKDSRTVCYKGQQQGIRFQNFILCKVCTNSEEGNIKLVMVINCTDGFMKD